MAVFQVPNSLKTRALAETEDAIVACVRSGDSAVVKNAGEYVVALTQAVEGAKRKLREDNIRVFQSNTLESEEVLAPVPESDPLRKRKVHHHKLKFTVILSSSPLEQVSLGSTQQLTEPAPVKPIRKTDTAGSASPELI